MGAASSSFRGRRMIVEGLAEGTVVPATSFEDGRPFKIKLISLDAIAEGASAAVLKGKIVAGSEKQSSLVVALKVFRLPFNAEQRELYRKLYSRELAAAQRLGAQDRFILPFLGTAVLGFQPVIISQFMRNGNILDYIVKCRPFKVHRQSLVIQVAEAVNFLHTEARLVHGDLKCENVMISDDGTALLADLGLSTVVDKAESHATTTTGVRQWNTVRFAAPELLLDNALSSSARDSLRGARIRSKTPQSDVYAFGMLVLQTFTGRLPWPDCSSEIVMMKMLSPKRPVHPRPGDNITALGLTDAWWDVCLACWQYDPERRPAIGDAWNKLRAAENPDRITFKGHTARVRAVAYLPCGTKVVSGSDDNTLRIWDRNTGELALGPLVGHEAWILCVAVSPDGRHIASGSNDSTIRQWDADTGAPIGGHLAAHTRSVTCLGYSLDGVHIVSGSADHTVLLWTPKASGGRRILLRQHSHGVQSVAFSPDGETIASTSRCVISLTTKTGLHVGFLEGHARSVQSVCFSPDGQKLISGSDDRTVRVWTVSTQELKFTLQTHSQSVRSVVILPSGRYIASASWDQSIRIWDALNGEAIGAPLIGHKDWVDTLAVSPDGKSLVSGSRDRTVRIWDRFE